MNCYYTHIKLNLWFENGIVLIIFKCLFCILRSGFSILQPTGLPHTQGTQRNSGKLKETQGNFGDFDSFFKLREVLIFSKNFREILRFF